MEQRLSKFQGRTQEGGYKGIYTPKLPKLDLISMGQKFGGLPPLVPI